ncbi:MULTISPECIES: hypothetical protein [Streptomyces]|nr:hypothetical protein [Streptomyces sp. W1SF4]
MTDLITHNCICEVPIERVPATFGPSADLLDRATAGWERFLSTFEAASDE